jgi:hypothetical protein
MDLAGDAAFGFPTHLVSAAVNVLDGGHSGQAIIYEPNAALSSIGGRFFVCGVDNFSNIMSNLGIRSASIER